MTQPQHPNTQERVRAILVGFSLDWWAVVIALALVALVWSGLLPLIGW